jgi:putative peptidoglycan lipid II flippase
VVALLAALALLVVVLVAVGSSSNHPRSGVVPGPTTTPAAVSIADVSVFHLERDADHASQVNATIDNNPDTVWWTDTYFDSRFAGLRHGLGLVIRLTGRHHLHELDVTSPSPGWSAEVYVADQIPSPPSLAPWGPPVATRGTIDGSTAFNLNNKEGSVILLWLTDLGPADKAGIAELVVR